jgi:hypothetical protein
MSNLVNEKEIDFNDKAIDKLYLAKGNRVTVKFKNISVPYLKGLVLRYSPIATHPYTLGRQTGEPLSST